MLFFFSGVKKFNIYKITLLIFLRLSFEVEDKLKNLIFQHDIIVNLTQHCIIFTYKFYVPDILRSELRISDLTNL